MRTYISPISRVEISFKGAPLKPPKEGKLNSQDYWMIQDLFEKHPWSEDK